MHYYQGLHDVASVLLLVGGEAPAFTMLCRLSTGHLRDATRPSLDPVIELLGLMAPILEAADPQLAAFVEAQGLPPFYALSWFITWFAHDLGDFGEVRRRRATPASLLLPLLPGQRWMCDPSRSSCWRRMHACTHWCASASTVGHDLTGACVCTDACPCAVRALLSARPQPCCWQVCRLFDLFLSTHPLMPLYVGAVAMASQRAALLAADEMPVLHSKLVNMRITKRASADQLAVQVGAL